MTHANEQLREADIDAGCDAAQTFMNSREGRRDNWRNLPTDQIADLRGFVAAILSTLSPAPITEAVGAAVKAEREACALIAETPVAGEQDDITMEAKDRIAAAIRARNPKESPMVEEKVGHAIEILERQLPDLNAAAIPTKCETYVICGWNARALHDAIKTVVAAARATAPRPGGGGEDAVERLQHVIDQDRYVAAACLDKIEAVLRSRAWLREAGRGSYDYADERYQQEFGLALDEIQEALTPLRRLSSDKSNCTTDEAEVIAAREAGGVKFAALARLRSTQPDAGERWMRFEDHPIGQAICDLRMRTVASNFAPEYSGQRGEDFDRGLLAAADAVRAVVLPTPPATSEGNNRG